MLIRRQWWWRWYFRCFAWDKKGALLRWRNRYFQCSAQCCSLSQRVWHFPSLDSFSAVILIMQIAHSPGCDWIDDDEKLRMLERDDARCFLLLTTNFTQNLLSTSTQAAIKRNLSHFFFSVAATTFSRVRGIFSTHTNHISPHAYRTEDTIPHDSRSNKSESNKKITHRQEQEVRDFQVRSEYIGGENTEKWKRSFASINIYDVLHPIASSTWNIRIILSPTSLHESSMKEWRGEKCKQWTSSSLNFLYAPSSFIFRLQSNTIFIIGSALNWAFCKWTLAENLFID